MLLQLLVGVAALVQLCVPGANASLRPPQTSAPDIHFGNFLGFLVKRYMPPGGDIVLCLPVDSDMPTLYGYLIQQPVLLVCPGEHERSRVPTGRQVVFLVVGTAPRLLQLAAELQPAVESSMWYSNVMMVAYGEEHSRDAGPRALAHTLIGMTWARSWSRTSVTVILRDYGVVYRMGSFRESPGKLNAFFERASIKFCGLEGPDVLLVATVRLSDTHSFASLPPKLYDDIKLPRDLGGCIMRASVLVGYRDRCESGAGKELPLDSRIAMDIMSAVARYRNVTVQLSFVDDHRMPEFANGTFSPPLSALPSYGTDVVAGMMEVTPVRIQYLRATTPFLQMPASLLVRCPATSGRPPRLHVWDVVSRNLWRSRGGGYGGYTGFVLLSCTALTIALRVAIARVSGRVPPTPWWWLSVVPVALLDHVAKVCEVVLTAWQLCPDVLSARVLTGTWLIFLLNMNVVIKGLLLTESAINRPRPPPQTVPELVASVPNLTVFVPVESMRPLLNETGVRLERVLACESKQEVYRCEDLFARNTNYAVTTVTHPSRIKCMRGCRYMMPGMLQQVNYVMYVRKTFGFVTVIDETIQRLQSGGLIERMLQVDSDRRSSRLARSMRGRNRGGRQRRRAHFNVQDPVFMLLGGQALAVVVFLVETAVHRFSAYSSA